MSNTPKPQAKKTIDESKSLVIYQWVKVKPYPKWWQFWKATHELKRVGTTAIKLIGGSDE